MFGIKETDSKSNTRMMFNTNRNKPLCNKKAYDMSIVTNRETSQIRTTSSYRKMNTKCNYMHVKNINMTMIDFFITTTHNRENIYCEYLGKIFRF
jgi:hypothetical protein